MIAIKEDTLIVGAETAAEEIVGLRKQLLEKGDGLKKVVIEGEIGRLGSTMLLQLLIALKKSRPQLVMEPFDFKAVDTPRWGRWSIV